MKIYTERRGNLRNNWRVFMRLCRPSSQTSTLFFQLAPPLEFSLFVSGLCLGSRGFWGLSSCSRSYRSRCSPGSSSSSQQQPQLVWKLRPEAAANEPWAFFFFWTKYSGGLPSPTRGHHFPICLIRSDRCLASILIHCFCTGPKGSEVLCAGSRSDFTCQLKWRTVMVNR